MDRKSGPRSENGDWTGYFVSGQEAIGHGHGFLVLAKRLREIDFGAMSDADKQTVWNAHAALLEWGDRFVSVDESKK